MCILNILTFRIADNQPITQSEAYRFLEREASNWYRIGKHLGMDNCEIRKIETDYEGCERRLGELLERWIQSHGRPKWNDFFKALNKLQYMHIIEKLISEADKINLSNTKE